MTYLLMHILYSVIHIFLIKLYSSSSSEVYNIQNVQQMSIPLNSCIQLASQNQKYTTKVQILQSKSIVLPIKSLLISKLNSSLMSDTQSY